jgi:hypothetical protein
MFIAGGSQTAIRGSDGRNGLEFSHESRFRPFRTAPEYKDDLAINMTLLTEWCT